MTNDAGWCGSGGPWITPELSMQYLVWTETSVEGGKHFEAALPEPQADGELLSRHHRAGLPHAGRQGPHREYQGQDGPRSPGSAAGPGQVCGSAGRPGHQGRVHRRSLRPVQGRPLELGRAGRQVDRAADRPHLDRRGQRPGPRLGPRPGMRQAEQGSRRRHVRRADGQDHRRQPHAGRQDARHHAHRQLGSPLARLDAADARGIPQTPRLRPVPLLARLHRPHRR